MTLRLIHGQGQGVICSFKGCRAIQGEKHTEACRQDFRNKILSYPSVKKEVEINFNTVVYSDGEVGDGTIYHTYSPWCPPGCRGQLDDCTYKA